MTGNVGEAMWELCDHEAKKDFINDNVNVKIVALCITVRLFPLIHGVVLDISSRSIA